MATSVGNEYFPFQVNKNQAFRLYFSKVNTDGNFAVNSTTSYISKDGSSRVAATNSIQTGATGAYYIDLTAEEMNADVVQILFDGDSPSNRDNCITIFTSGYTNIYVGNVADSVIGNLKSLKKFLRRNSSSFTDRQLLLLLIKILKSA